MPRLISAGEVLLGKGSLAALKALDAARLAVLVSPSLYNDVGQRKLLEGSVKAESIEIVPMPGGEPTMSRLRPVVAALTAFRPDWIVAVGGGSVIDGAKLSWVFYEQPEADLERLSRPFALTGMRGRARFAAVPTTAGTGSEVSSSAILLDETSGAKHPVVSHELLPDLAVLDPSFAVGVPAHAVAAAGFDALAHALESYVSKFANPFADAQAEKAVAILLEHLATSWREPDNLTARMEIMQAALMAGWVQNLKVPGIGHAVAHQLGGHGLSHGLAAGLLLVPAMQFNAEDATVQSRYQTLAKRVGLSGDEALYEALVGLKHELGLTVSDEVAAAIRKDSAGIYAGAQEDVCAKANPLPFTEEDVSWMLNEAL
ncbi:MAG: iron-containing alcohol dehydrogenase [Verrucomicrobiota bacterium]